MSNYKDDQFSDQFAEFFVENLDVYGDTEEGMEEAYNDFISATTEDEYSEAELDAHVDAFSNFYAEMEDVYGDTEEGMEEAYADFLELSNTLEEEDEYASDDLSEEEQAFVDYYTDTQDIYGDNLEDAYADFLELMNEEVESEYSAEDYYGDVYGDTYGDFVEEFADFYAEMEDVYGDNVELAFDDYADAIENLSIEDTYADEPAKPSAFQRAKSGVSNFAGSRGGTATAGAALGALAGAGIGAATDPNAKRRKELKAKAKAGNITQAEANELAKLKSARAGRLMKAAGGGAVAGGLAGAASHTAVHQGVGQVKSNLEKRKKAKAWEQKAADLRAKGREQDVKLADRFEKQAKNLGQTKVLGGVGGAMKSGYQADAKALKDAKDRGVTQYKENVATRKKGGDWVEKGNKMIEAGDNHTGNRFVNMGQKMAKKGRLSGVMGAIRNTAASDMTENTATEDRTFSFNEGKTSEKTSYVLDIINNKH